MDKDAIMALESVGITLLVTVSIVALVLAGVAVLAP